MNRTEIPESTQFPHVSTNPTGPEPGTNIDHGHDGDDQAHEKSLSKDTNPGRLCDGQKSQAADSATGAASAQVDPWQCISAKLQEYDKEKVKRCQEDIDTLLIVSTLLSAVLAAFLVQSNTLLQPNSTDTTNQILLHLSSQLGSLSLNPTFLNSTVPPLTGVPSGRFQLDASAVHVNVAWFISLALSILATLLGVTGKQWLHRFVEYASLPTSRDNARLREYVSEGVRTWRMYDVLAFLSSLILLALLLFLLGMLEFLFVLDKGVFTPVAVIVGIGLGLWVVSWLLPVLSADCPYKSPLAWLPVRTVTYIQFVITAAIAAITLVKKDLASPSNPPSNFIALSRKLQKLKRALEGWLERDNAMLVAPDTSYETSFRNREIQALGFVYSNFRQDAEAVQSVFTSLRALDFPGREEAFMKILAQSMGYSDYDLMEEMMDIWPEYIRTRFEMRMLPLSLQEKELDFVLDYVKLRVEEWKKKHLSGQTPDFERRLDRNKVDRTISLVEQMFLTCRQRSTELDDKFVRLLFNLDPEWGAPKLCWWCCHLSSEKLSIETVKEALNWANKSQLEASAPDTGTPLVTLVASVPLIILAHKLSALEDKNVLGAFETLLSKMSTYLNPPIPNARVKLPENKVLKKLWLAPLAKLKKSGRLGTIRLDKFADDYTGAYLDKYIPVSSDIIWNQITSTLQIPLLLDEDPETEIGIRSVPNMSQC